MFIRDGRIVLDAPMEDIGDRYVEVLVNADRLENARALKPVDERALPFGKTVMLFDRTLSGCVPQSQLETLGETRTPGLADLFVATMKGTYA
jgi:ABC-2 type transport system ATP-binding protein